MDDWIYVTHGTESTPITISGLDVWLYPWHAIGDERATVRDPLHGQPFVFRVYQITNGHRIVEFAAGEFSNGIWGFFARPTTDAARPAV
jgi:hypothetical protein